MPTAVSASPHTTTRISASPGGHDAMPNYAPIFAGTTFSAGITLPPTANEWTRVPTVASDFGVNDPTDQVDGDAPVAGCSPGQVLVHHPNFKLTAASADGNAHFSIGFVVDGAVVATIGSADGSGTGSPGWEVSQGADELRRPTGPLPALLTAAMIDTDQEARPVLMYKNLGSTNLTIECAYAFGFAMPFFMVDGPLVRRRVNQFVADGQSLLRSGNGTDVDAPAQLGAVAKAGGHRAVVSNFAVSGESFAYRISNGRDERYRLAPIGYSNNILLSWGGFDDIDNGLTAQEVVDLQTAQATEAKSHGFDRVIAITLTPSTVINGADETTRTDYNTLLLAQAGGVIDAVADAASLPELIDPTNTTYYADGLHFTTAGSAAVADLLYATARPYLI